MNKKTTRSTDQDIFERIVEVTRLSNKYELSSDRLTCSDGGVNLIFGVVTVQLGKGNYEMKIAQISPILEKLNEKFAGQAGVLHLENYETSGTSVRFVPEKAAETEADEARTPDRRTKISQENLKLHRRIRHLQQEPVKEKQLNKKT